MRSEKEAPIQIELRSAMNAMAEALDDAFDPYGFALFVFPKNTTDGRVNYISNCERESMIIAMKQFIAKCENRFDETDAVQ